MRRVTNCASLPRGGSSPTLLAADTLGLARSYGCRLRLEAGRYEWTVAAFNSGYETSSPALRLTVAEEPVSEEPEKSDNPESAEP